VPARHVRHAFLDGPIDSRSYSAQPVILEKLPSLEDGDAITQTVTVLPGEQYVSNGEILTATEELLTTQMVVTFTLLADLRWSDGEPLTAADSAFSFDVACHPDTPVANRYTCDRTTGYEAVGDRDAVWTSLPGFFDRTYYVNFWAPLPEHVLGDMTPDEILESDYGEKPLGWGAYAVHEWVTGEYISLTRNPYYWRAGLPAVERLVFVFIDDPEEALAALLRGDVHVVADATDETLMPTYQDLEAEDVLQVHAIGGTVWEHLDFGIQPADERVPFFADVTVRQAVARSLNRQKMVDDILHGMTEVLHSFIPPEHPAYPPDGVLTEYDYDPATARTLLESAGWRDDDSDGVREAHGVSYQVPTWDWDAHTYGPTQTVNIPDGTPLEVTFQTTSSDLRQAVGAQLQQDLAAIGIAVTIDHPEDFWGNVFSRRFDLCEFAWLTGVEPPCDLFMAYNIPEDANGWSGQNNSGFVDQAYDAACTAALTASDNSTYLDQIHTAQGIFSEKLPVLPLFPRIKTMLASAQVLGIQLDPTESSGLWNVEEWVLGAQGQATAEEGGGVQSNDGRTTIALGSGVVTDTVTLSLTPWVIEPPGGNLSGTGHAFDLTAVYSDTGQPAGLQSGASYGLSVEYSEAELPDLVREETLALFHWDGSQWLPEPSSDVDPGNDVVTATPDHFSVWAVLGEIEHVYLPLVVRNY
jgi:peptide/nickel transport system substrate-binding protein